MRTKKSRLFALLACLTMLFANQVQAQKTDDLQQLIDQVASRVTRAGTPTDIDLSPYSAPRTATLYVRNGVNVRFINGTLTRATSLTDAPLVQIIDNSTLHVASSAAISGGNFVTTTTLVEVKDGELDVEGGKVIGNIEKTSTSSRLGFSVTLTNSNSAIRVNSGEVQYLYQYAAASQGTIDINGGTFNWINISGYASIAGFVNGAIRFGNKDAYITLTNGILGGNSNLRLYGCQEGQVAVRNVQSLETANCFQIGYDDEDKFVLSYESNSLVVRSKTPADPNLIYNEQQLRSRLTEIADNKESSESKPVKLTVAPDGFAISSSVMISGCYVEITGGRLTISKNTSHSPFMIFEGSGLTLNDIEIDFNKFDSYYRGFDNNGGYLTIGSGTVFLNAVSAEWYSIPFYYLYSGITTISPTSRNVCNEVYSIYFSNFEREAQVRFTSSPSYVRIMGNWDSYNSEVPYTLVKGSGYTLKESDFKNMRFENLPDRLEVYYDNSDKTVKLRLKKDPNYIESEDDLQKRLDEIAEEKPQQPVTLTIREEGITLTRSILAKGGCKAIIIGGKIEATKAMTQSADGIFYIQEGADITFNGITLNLPNLRANYCYQFVNNGTLAFWDMDIYTSNDMLTIDGECRIYGYTRLPMLYLSSRSRIHLLSSLQNTRIIDGDWSNFTLDDPYTIVSGYNYTVTKDDFSRMQFVNMPDDVEAAYDEQKHVVVIQKRTTMGDVLQCLIDGGTDCMPKDSVVVDDITDIGCENDPLQCAVDLELPKKDEGEDYPIRPIIWFCGCARHGTPEIIRINQYSKLTVHNIDFRGTRTTDQYIYVRGKFVISRNVYIYRFLRFVYVTTGGHLVWRGGYTVDVDEPIYNDGGKVELEGGEISGDIKNISGDMTIYNGTIIHGNIWSYVDFKIGGSVKVTNIYIKRGVRIHVTSKPTEVWNIHFIEPDGFGIYTPIIIGGDGYKITEEDLKYFHFELPDGYRCIYFNGTIIIVRIVYNVETITEYLDYFGPMGTLIEPKKIVYNTTCITIERDWHIRRDFHLLFDEGMFDLTGGNIYIDEGASLWLKNIRFKGIGYHIYVYGTLYIDEDVDFNEIIKFIHLCKGGQIRFVKQPTHIVNIFISEEDIVTYKAIITDIKEEWLQYINIELPDGYRWIFVDGTIVIVRIPYNVVTLEEFLEYYGPQGTEELPWSFIYNTTNITIERDWHIKRDFHLLFDEGLFTFTGGNIYIDEGASLWLKNFSFKGTGYHIYVNGILIIDENVNFGEIIKFVHLLKGGKIIVKKRLASILYMVVGDVTHGDILNIDGLTENDLPKLDILLPDGYFWEYENGTIVVKELAVTVTAKDYTREYGESNPVFEFTTEGAALKGQPEISCEATAASPVGTYPIVVKKGSVTNHNDTYVNGTLTITKAPLTVKAGIYTKKQGEENPEFTLTYEGFKNSETEAVLTKKPVATTTAVKDSPTGDYEITVSGAEAENYEISYVNGTLKVIDADAIVVMAKSYTREYGEANPTFEYTAEGATLEGTPEISCEATATSAVGSYPIVITKGSVANYNDSYVNGTLTITKAPLTVKAKSYTIKQGEALPTFEVEYEGWKNGETESVLIKKPVTATTATKDSPAGEYDITVSGGEAQNYELSYVKGMLTIAVPDGIAEVLMAQGIRYIFSPNGKRIEKLRKGLNIVVMNDGTVRKVVMK